MIRQLQLDSMIKIDIVVDDILTIQNTIKNNLRDPYA